MLNYGLPQGSCIGPQLFFYYTHHITDVIKWYSDVKYHFYADDTQLYVCVDPCKPGETDSAIPILSNCISEIKNWMSNNMLLLNDDKTEFFVAANPRLVNILSDISIIIGNTVIRPSPSVRNLGVTFDTAMTMSNHISSVCKTLIYGTYHVLEFSLMKQHVTMQSAQSSLHVLIMLLSLLILSVHLVKKLAVFNDSKTSSRGPIIRCRRGVSNIMFGTFFISTVSCVLVFIMWRNYQSAAFKYRIFNQNQYLNIQLPNYLKMHSPTFCNKVLYPIGYGAENLRVVHTLQFGYCFGFIFLYLRSNFSSKPFYEEVENVLLQVFIG